VGIKSLAHPVRRRLWLARSDQRPGAHQRYELDVPPAVALRPNGRRSRGARAAGDASRLGRPAWKALNTETTEPTENKQSCVVAACPQRTNKLALWSRCALC